MSVRGGKYCTRYPVQRHKYLVLVPVDPGTYLVPHLRTKSAECPPVCPSEACRVCPTNTYIFIFFEKMKHFIITRVCKCIKQIRAKVCNICLFRPATPFVLILYTGKGSSQQDTITKKRQEIPIGYFPVSCQVFYSQIYTLN